MISRRYPMKNWSKKFMRFFPSTFQSFYKIEFILYFLQILSRFPDGIMVSEAEHLLSVGSQWLDSISVFETSHFRNPKTNNCWTLSGAKVWRRFSPKTAPFSKRWWTMLASCLCVLCRNSRIDHIICKIQQTWLSCIFPFYLDIDDIFRYNLSMINYV